MTDIIIEKSNESFVQLHCNEEINHEINRLFSAFAPGYRFNPRYKQHLWDGRITVYSPITQLLPIGLVSNLINWCKTKGYTYQMNFFDNFTENVDKNKLKEIVNSYIKKFNIRDYQFDAVYKSLTNKKGILLSCTGSGKSLMIYCIFRYLLEVKKLKHLLLIVPNTSLVEQMYDDFVDYGWDNIEDSVEMLYSGKKPTFEKPILISTWQSLQMQDKDFFEKYNSVLVDECVNENTLILTPSGEKPIKDIKTGELVITYNEKNKIYEANKVLEVHQNHISSKNKKMLHLELEDGKILELTENHPVFTTNRGWVRAGELNENDDIEIINNIETSEDGSKK